MIKLFAISFLTVDLRASPSGVPNSIVLASKGKSGEVARRECLPSSLAPQAHFLPAREHGSSLVTYTAGLWNGASGSGKTWPGFSTRLFLFPPSLDCRPRHQCRPRWGKQHMRHRINTSLVHKCTSKRGKPACLAPSFL